MLNYEDLEPVQIKIHEFCEKCNVELLSGDETEYLSFTSVLINRPGLFLAGFKEYFGYFRIQLIGNAEHYYLKSIEEDKRKQAIESLFSQHIPCIIYSRGISPSEYEFEMAAKYHIPLMGAKSTTTYLSNIISNYLEEILAPMTTIHGTLMDVAGVGVLITGESGMGKSEAALELVQRGHRLISDDVVICKRISDKIVGTYPEKTKFLMEVRGLGIIDVAAMYGTGSVLNEEEIMLIVNLKNLTDKGDCERVGSKLEHEKILDLEIPKYNVPVLAGRSVAVLIEVAVRNFRLKNMGQDAFETLLQRTGLRN